MSKPDNRSDDRSANQSGDQSAAPAGDGGAADADADVAVALAYAPKADNAPRVVAKGSGTIAKSIIEIARANGVAIEQNADLATLLQAVDLDKEIPPEAFAAVAEILGYLYRANGKLAEVSAARAEDDTQ